MAASIPYLLSATSLKSALDKIRSAATPPRVTKDFVNSVLLIKGGTGDAIAPYLKRIGFVASDGTPTDLYKRFRNLSTGGTAVAEAVRLGYKELASANEYFHTLQDHELRALIVQVTGLEVNSRVTAATLSTLKMLLSYADFNGVPDTQATASNGQEAVALTDAGSTNSVLNTSSRFNLSYTINLNLPATSDQAVFNAIFRSLKEHILSNE